MFVEERSLAAVVADLCSDGGYHALYIAAHGDECSIGGLGHLTISPAKLRNIFRINNGEALITGLCFGGCLIGILHNARFWLTGKPSVAVKWIGGYTISVDWINSSATDVIFWSRYLHERKRNRSRRKGKRSELEMAKHAAGEMKTLMPTVFNQLGFNIYHLDSGGSLVSIW